MPKASAKRDEARRAIKEGLAQIASAADTVFNQLEKLPRGAHGMAQIPTVPKEQGIIGDEKYFMGAYQDSEGNLYNIEIRRRPDTSSR